MRATRDVMIDGKAEVRSALEVRRQHLQNLFVYAPHSLVADAERLRLTLDQRFFWSPPNASVDTPERLC